MKKFTLIAILLSILAVGISCQQQKKSSTIHVDTEFDNGSGIVFPPIDEQLITNLELLGKLWGFLKYHHPQVAKGNYNWDYELFRFIPTYLKTDSNDERDKTLLDWITKYGDIPACTTCKETPSDAYLKPDFSWVEKGNIHSDLKDKIYEIYKNRNQGRHYYISSPGGIPEFVHENPYSKMVYPDAGFRLLALYRYWNIIHYFFPYKYITDKNWDDMLNEYIPMFISAQSRLDYQLAAVQIIGDINDTHANLNYSDNEIQKFRGHYYAPFNVRFVEEKWVVITNNNTEIQTINDCLLIGDIITHIDGKTVESIIDSIRIFYPASNEAVRMRDISGSLLRSKNNVMNIRYISSGQEKQKELSLFPKDMIHRSVVNIRPNDKYHKQIMDGNIGYITLDIIDSKDISEIIEKFKNTKGIIIDIRCYPKTFVPYRLGSFFVSKSTPFVKLTKGNINNPGEFTFFRTEEVPTKGETYQGKLVILVNERTVSQAEFTAMAFKAGDNTTIVGSTTAGADGNVSSIYLPGGLYTKFTAIGVYYPNGTPTQRIGIVPDVWVEPTINGIIQRRDEVLEKAIEIIQQL